jgi:hypothetical protein
MCPVCYARGAPLCSLLGTHWRRTSPPPCLVALPAGQAGRRNRRQDKEAGRGADATQGAHRTRAAGACAGAWFGSGRRRPDSPLTSPTPLLLCHVSPPPGGGQAEGFAGVETEETVRVGGGLWAWALPVAKTLASDALPLWLFSDTRASVTSCTSSSSMWSRPTLRWRRCRTRKSRCVRGRLGGVVCRLLHTTHSSL